MNIKILGSGCAKCAALYENTKKAVAEMGIDATVEKVTDFAQIATYGVMRTPALVVDEKVKIAAKVATVEEIKAVLK